MIFNKLGKTGFTTSRLGFGFMRPPMRVLADGTKVFDEEKAISNIRYAIDCGINYVDTAYGYPGNEVLLGKALKDGYREKVNITTKALILNINNREDYNRMFNEELMRLETDYIDTYLFHNIRPAVWKNVVDYDGLSVLEKLKDEGKIKRIGFSLHADYDFFKEVVDYYNWDFCMVQYNILDQKFQVGLEGIQYAKSKGLAVGIMEPLKGGILSKNIPEEVKILLKENNIKSLPDLCLRWLSRISEIDVIVSGMSNLDDVKKNLKTFESTQTASISETELALVDEIVEIYNAQNLIPCSSCGYCMPCPQNVNIPNIFKVYNDSVLAGSDRHGKSFYRVMVELANGKGSNCTRCGLCVRKCPQSIDIPKYIEEASFKFETK